MELEGLLHTVGRATGPGYAARPISGSSLHFVGRDAEGFPVIMLGARDSPQALTPPLHLHAIDVQFAVLCQVSLPDGQCGEHRLSVMRCTSADLELQRYFLKVVGVVVSLIGAAPAFTQVTGALRRVIELFQQLDRPPKRELTGLYGELLLIMWSVSAKESLRAWRTDSVARFDFSTGDVRIDAKASASRLRSHNFSLAQCRPPPGTTGLIASLLLEPGTGASVGDLVRKIEARLGSEVDLVVKLHEIVANALGAGLVEGLKFRFDERAARASLRWYFTADIPSPQDPLSSAVSDVRFKSDLSAVGFRTRAEILKRAPDAGPILPQDWR